MIETKVAKRYARSLIGLSNEKGMMDEVNNDMKLIASAGQENRDLALLLSNPIVNSDKKLSILDKIFSGKISKLTMSFIDIVIRKGREKYLLQIATAFTDQYKVLKGILTAEIVSAVGLDEKLRKKVYELIRGGSDSEVELIEKVDPKLIGGFILRIGDKQYDASITSDIRKLAQSFSKNPYIKQN